MTYSVYGPHGEILGKLASKGIPARGSKNSFALLIDQVARGVRPDDLVIVQDKLINGVQSSHKKYRTTLGEIMGFALSGTKRELAEYRRIVRGLHSRGYSVSKIVQETNLTKPQIFHILGMSQ